MTYIYLNGVDLTGVAPRCFPLNITKIALEEVIHPQNLSMDKKYMICIMLIKNVIFTFFSE